MKTTKGDLQHLKPRCHFFVFKYGDTVSYKSTVLQYFNHGIIEYINEIKMSRGADLSCVDKCCICMIPNNLHDICFTANIYDISNYLDFIIVLLKIFRVM